MNEAHKKGMAAVKKVLRIVLMIPGVLYLIILALWFGLGAPLEANNDVLDFGVKYYIIFISLVLGGLLFVYQTVVDKHQQVTKTEVIQQDQTID